jgi:hypothetical protein
MRNAKEELVDKLNSINKKIEWANIDYIGKMFILKRGFSKEDYNNFLNSLDFNYDNGYGGQCLFGNVVFENKTWLSRGEYDESEWWDYNECPEILIQCINKG